MSPPWPFRTRLGAEPTGPSGDPSATPLEPEDVRLVYELLLERTPSGAEVQHQLEHAETLRGLLEVVAESDERRVRRASAAGAVPAVDVPAAPVGDGDDWAGRFPPPERPWTAEYAARHQALVSAAIDDASLRAAIAGGGALPDGYAVGYDERTIEYPWTFGQGVGGRVLDAGSTFNHGHILDRALPLVDALTITTLAPEAQAFPQRGVSYVFADLRDLPFRDAWFDTVVSLSTLEHVGKDNRTYGVHAAATPDPDHEVCAAARELRRVTRPGGRILLSVPFGRREDHGWFRQFDEEDLQQVVAAFGPAKATVSIFRYAREGWQRGTPAEAAWLRYRDFAADASPVDDLAAAARAVACVALEV